MSYAFGLPATCDAGPLGPSLADVCTASQFFLFISLLNALIRHDEKISGKCERVEPVEETLEEYDFIVVGGGAAGSVVAARLSENRRVKVLLLEAGPDEPAGAQVPGYATRFLGTNIVWNYTTHEKCACLATKGSCAINHGKNLGGNTVHNGMIYLRGQPSDYDYWAEQGNEGWGWKDVKPYFLKNEDNGEIDRVGRDHHATGGPQSVERFPYVPPFALSILEASVEAGYGVSDDLNGDQKTGFAIIQAMQKKGVRRSSARSYLWPARKRKNLHVSLNSLVTKLIFFGDTAVGVQYEKDGEVRSARAIREVIVSGGAFESPHILLLSGIGPSKHLETLGIKVVKDLPGVGKNLHDHLSVVIPSTINEPDTYDNDWVTAIKYLVNQTGSLSCIGTASALGMLVSENSVPDYPDVGLGIYGYLSNCGTGEIGSLQSTGWRNLQLTPSYLYPKSRGSVTLASKDPHVHPSIRMNYLTESEDIERIVDAIKMSIVLFETDALRAYNPTVVGPIEGCSDHYIHSDGYWACVARHNTYPMHHEGGTCKMGPSSDPMAVVDNRLRVHGIKSLRVVDNSIMPVVPASNTAAPAMMIGERAADLIKEDWYRIFD